MRMAKSYSRVMKEGIILYGLNNILQIWFNIRYIFCQENSKTLRF